MTCEVLEAESISGERDGGQDLSVRAEGSVAVGQTLDTHIGPTTLYTVGATKQVSDYGRFNWTMFDAEERNKRHEDVFPSELMHARELGSRIFS